MALSYSDLGRVDLNPVTQGEPGQKTDLRMVVADITISQTDYVGSDGGIVPVGTNIGLNNVLFAHGTIRASSGTVDTGQVLVWDANLKGLRGLEIGASTAAALSEVTSADFANGDVIRVIAVGQ